MVWSIQSHPRRQHIYNNVWKVVYDYTSYTVVIVEVNYLHLINQSINQSFICSNNNKNMHINTSESSRTARSHKNTDSCPEKEYSMTIIQFIITQNYRFK